MLSNIAATSWRGADYPDQAIQAVSPFIGRENPGGQTDSGYDTEPENNDPPTGGRDFEDSRRDMGETLHGASPTRPRRVEGAPERCEDTASTSALGREVGGLGVAGSPRRGSATSKVPTLNIHAHHCSPQADVLPHPVQGRVGLRRLDEATTARILAQIGEAA